MDRRETVGSHCWIGHEVIHDMFVRAMSNQHKKRCFGNPQLPPSVNGEGIH